MTLTRKKFLIGVGVLLVVCLAGAIALTLWVNSMKGETGADAKLTVVGNWKEDTAGTVMALTEQGKVEISGTQAASYTVNKKDKTLTFEYSQAFGGQTVTMNYTLTDTTMALTNTSTNQVQNYTRVDSSATSTANPSPSPSAETTADPSATVTTE